MTADSPGWRVPGTGFVQIVPPREWTRTILHVTSTPPSMNENRIRSNWRGFHKVKKQWQDEIGWLLIAQQTPKGSQRVMAGATIRFPRRAARRDSGNFAGVIEKALGDALVTYGAITDDDAARFYFAGVEFEQEVGSPMTRIFIYSQPQEDTDGNETEG
ncbi:MAG: hypothetical protein NVS3B1_12630 [Marmoricola sp.]